MLLTQNILEKSLEGTNNIIDWAFNVAPDTPLHFSRYFPSYQTKYPATSEKLMYKTYKKAVKKLDYVYLGNIQDKEVNSTYCPKCKNILVERNGYEIGEININEKGECINCDRPVDIVIK